MLMAPAVLLVNTEGLVIPLLWETKELRAFPFFPCPPSAAHLHHQLLQLCQGNQGFCSAVPAPGAAYCACASAALFC